MRYTKLVAFLVTALLLTLALSACEVNRSGKITIGNGEQSAVQCPGTGFYAASLSDCPQQTPTPSTSTEPPATATSAPVTPTPVVNEQPTPQPVAQFAAATATSAPAPQRGNASAVSNGTTLKKGTLAVWEVVDNGTSKTIDVWGGNLGADFPVGIDGLVHRDAWQGYVSVQDAQWAACSTAKERLSETAQGQWAAGYTVTLNGAKFTGNCDDGTGAASATATNSGSSTAAPVVNTECNGAEPTIIAIDPGQGSKTLPAGSCAVVEVVNNDATSVRVFGGKLTSSVTCQISGSTHVNCWYGYGSALAAQKAARGETTERASEAKVSGSWNEGYTVTQVDNQDQLGN